MSSETPATRSSKVQSWPCCQRGKCTRHREAQRDRESQCNSCVLLRTEVWGSNVRTLHTRPAPNLCGLFRAPPALAAAPRARLAAPATLAPPERRGEESVAAVPRRREPHEASRVKERRRGGEIGEIREAGELGGRHGCELGALLRGEEGVDLCMCVRMWVCACACARACV